MTTQVKDSWLGLDGASVLVAGAGGIGRACVAGYLDAGARVTVMDRDEESLLELKQSAAAPERLETLQVDLTDERAAQSAVSRTIEQQGGLDVAFHCIGVNDRRPILDFTPDEWSRILEINLSTAFVLLQAAGRHMVVQGSGRVLAMSSVASYLAHAHHGPYAASKAGMNQLLKTMAREWAPHGVTVNGIAPGYIKTDLTADYLARGDNEKTLTALVPSQRLGTPDEVVGTALFLSSKQSSFVTGQILYVDGGRTLV